jgi:hypothetical protein
MAASVRQRLLNLSRERGEAFEYLLNRYGTERLLYRLSQSSSADQFILKGASLFQLWSDELHRPTRDVDLLGHGEPSLQRMSKLFAEICRVEVEDDGLVFEPNSVKAEQIREDDEYQGIRIKLTAYLEEARVSLQADVGFGDAITPPPEEIEYPTLLDQASPRLKAYPREAVVAEKYQAMVILGMANSRMKDFFDLWILATRFEFQGPVIAKAIRETFARRHTALPNIAPLALTAEFAEDNDKSKQWSAFLLRGNLTHHNLTLQEVTELLQRFLMPPTDATRLESIFQRHWKPPGPWVPSPF